MKLIIPPSPPETRSAGQRDVADVGRRGTGDGLVDDEGAVLEVSAAVLLHLPKVLQRLHDIDCKRMNGYLLTMFSQPCHKTTDPTLYLLSK